MPFDSLPPSFTPAHPLALPLPTPSPSPSPSSSPSPYALDAPPCDSSHSNQAQRPPQHRPGLIPPSLKPTITHVISERDLHSIASPTRLVRDLPPKSRPASPLPSFIVSEPSTAHLLANRSTHQDTHLTSPLPTFVAQYRRQIDPDLRTESSYSASSSSASSSSGSYHRRPPERSPFDNSYAVPERAPSSLSTSTNHSRHHLGPSRYDDASSFSSSGRGSPIHRHLTPTSSSGRPYKPRSAYTSDSASDRTRYLTPTSGRSSPMSNHNLSTAPMASESASNRNSQVSASGSPGSNPDYSIRSSGQPPSPVFGPEVPLHQDFDVNTPLPVIRSPGSSSRSPSRSASSLRDPFQDDRHQNYASSRSLDPRLGEVNPQIIADDGDDGLVYGKPSRNSLINLHRKSASSVPPNVKAAAAMGGAVILNTLPVANSAENSAMGSAADVSTTRGSAYNVGAAAAAGYTPDALAEKGQDALDLTKKKQRQRKLCLIITLGVLLIAAIIGGTLGGYFGNRNKKGSSSDKSSSNGQSASDDAQSNGILTKDSAEIKRLLNNENLHKVFPGIDYTPLNTQYPDCLENPPSQNNITRDLAVLSQLTNTIRLYGTDCNQTEMVLEGMKNLDVSNSMSVWLGVWQDSNTTTNERQLAQMWDILDNYGTTPFRGIIVANEILFREEMTETELGNLMSSVRSNLTTHGLDALPVCTSDLGDKWTASLADKSDVIMSNIHPFFGGVTYADAANWTWSFFNTHNDAFFKSDAADNIISEIGWPSGGGTNCPTGVTGCGDAGSVAGTEGLNVLLQDWVCDALANGTNYFWFSAFDEPWKIRFNEDGKEWEDKWGMMDVDRNLKDGVVIPDCGGRTVS
ncbi:hypothetical protein BROUX41_004401 [Berkeleyomyces rouxiae]